MHRNTLGLSDIGKMVIEKCPNAYVNERGQVIDPCHFWISETHVPTSWEIGQLTIGGL